MREYRLTYAELNALTLPQVWNLRSSGESVRVGVRRFGSSAEARAYRESRRNGKQ